MLIYVGRGTNLEFALPNFFLATSVVYFDQRRGGGRNAGISLKFDELDWNFKEINTDTKNLSNFIDKFTVFN